MDDLELLNSRLRLVCRLLDGAAGIIRGVPLTPTNEHIRRIGEALASVYEVQRAIYQLRPDLETPYDEPPEEVAAANRRLGETLIAAYDLADGKELPEAIALLSKYVQTESSREHSKLAAVELSRMRRSYEP